VREVRRDIARIKTLQTERRSATAKRSKEGTDDAEARPDQGVVVSDKRTRPSW
jgi:hypothetical protein